MKDEKLMRLSLLIAIVGIIGLYATVIFIGPEVVTIGSVSEDDTGKQITVNANVASMSVSNGNIFLKLYDGTGNITAVMFERTARGTKAYDVKEGANLTVTGQVNIYRGDIEIIVSSLGEPKPL